MSAIWESANWTRQFGIRQTGNRQFGMLPARYSQTFIFSLFSYQWSTFTGTKITVLTRQF